MTWWQAFLVFTIYGTGARVDALLYTESDFGWFARLIINLPFTVGAYLLINTWAGLYW